MDDVDTTRRSWNIATRNHNAHKGDQAAFLRAGGTTLFPEEVALLGPLAGRRLVHLQCNAGQDTLSLARLGAAVTGVDLSDEAIRFARALADGAGIPATFVEAELLAWMREPDNGGRFDVAFSSYGAVGWIGDLAGWARGIAHVLAPAGRFVYVEFHPVTWTISADLRMTGDDYFAEAPFRDPVSDYVAESGVGLGAVAPGETAPNDVPAISWQHGLGATVSALADAGLRVETLREYPYANGCKVHPALVMDADRRWRWPDGSPRLPLMFGLSVRKDP